MNSLEDLHTACTGGHQNIDEFLSQVLEFITTHTNSNIGIISLVDDSGTWLRYRAKHVVGSDPDKWMLGQRFFLPIGGEELPARHRSLSGYSAFIKKAYRSGNVQNEGFYLSIDDSVRSELVVPILLGEKLLGVVNLESYKLNFLHRCA